MSEPIRPWTVLASRRWMADGHVALRTERCRTGGGAVVDPFHVVETPDWAAVVGLTAGGGLICVTERIYRHATGLVLAEFPAGKIDPEDPTPEHAARRELLEETGYAPARLIPLAPMFPSTGRMTTRAYPFLGLGLERVQAPELEYTEELETFETPLPDFLDAMEKAQGGMPGVHYAMGVAAMRWLARSDEAGLAAERAAARAWLCGA